MAVNILPQDTITPALQNVFGQLNNINLAKMQEETRKRNELAQLSEVSLQNISANDNIYLQKQKDQFIKDAAKSYGENKGYLPYETQAELNARKSNILMEAKASEEWKKQYEDVVKQMATSDKIDKVRTGKNLKDMMATQGGEVIPPSQRPNPYDAVSLNFDTNTYIKSNLNKELQKTTRIEGRKTINTAERTADNVYGQIKEMMTTPAFKMKMNENARDAGYDDVDKYIKEQVVPNHTHKDETFTYHWPSQTNNYIMNSGDQGGTQGQGIVVKIAKKDGSGYVPQTYTPSEVYPNPPATVSLNGRDILLSNSVGKEVTGPLNIEIQSTGYFPSVYNARLKRWFVVTDENKDTFKPEEIESRPWFVGTTQQGSGDRKQNVITFVPVTEERKKIVEAKLGNDAGKQPYKIKVDAVKSSNTALDPKTMVTINGKKYSVEQLRQNPNNTDEVIMKFIK